ncbi:putative ribosomal protein L7/L12 [Dioscorea sansibarensis]
MNPLFRCGHRLLLPTLSTAAIRISGCFYSQQAAARKEEELEIFDQRKLPADFDPANFDPADHRGPPTARVWRLVDEVSALTLSEVADLSSILASKLRMKELPVIAAMNSGTGFAGGMSPGGDAAGVKKEEEKKHEKTVFELKLESFEAASKIKVIKEVRGFTDLGLKEAKELVEKTPVVIKGGVSKEEGQQIIEKMKAVGAKVVLE